MDRWKKQRWVVYVANMYFAKKCGIAGSSEVKNNRLEIIEQVRILILSGQYWKMRKVEEAYDKREFFLRIFSVKVF